MSMFIPKKIKVGYQKRSDTYSQKLAYVIYYDTKNKLRKETSWQNWRDKDMGDDEFDNTPMEGFVLNKKVGGTRYHYDMRQTYTRVYDPRGFEVEITIPNLLHILEHTSSIRGKGLEGEFVYAWDGTELVLLPVSSPDYEDLQKKTETLIENNYIKGSELVVGKTYGTIDGEGYVYLGKYPKVKYNVNTWQFPYEPVGKDIPKEEWFTLTKPQYWFISPGGYLHTLSSVTNKFYSCVNEAQHPEMESYLYKLHNSCEFSPIDFERMDFVEYTYEEFLKELGCSSWAKNFFYMKPNKEVVAICFERAGRFDDQEEKYKYYRRYWQTVEPLEWNDPWRTKIATAKELYDNFKFGYVQTYLKNGEEYKKEKRV